MNETLENEFGEIERQRLDLASRIAALSVERVRRKSKMCAWTIGEIVEHLVLSDEVLGRAVDSSVAAAEPRLFRLIPHQWRFALVIDALNKDVVLPTPTPLIQPKGGIPLPGLMARWEEIRSLMHSDIIWLDADDRRYFHPALGLLSAKNMLQLIRTHSAYHIRQIDSELRQTRNNI